MPHAGVGTLSLRLAPLALTWLAAVPGAHAQTTATVTTTAKGGAAASIMPGQSVEIAVRISHNAVYLGSIAGGSVVTAGAGVPSNISTTIPSLPTVNLGEFVGGSRVGAEILVSPPWMIGPSPPFGTVPMPVWQYTLRLDDPGVYTVNWVPSASMPNVHLFQTFSSITPTEAQTTYVGATITVVPSPASVALLAPVFLIAASRRR